MPVNLDPCYLKTKMVNLPRLSNSKVPYTCKQSISSSSKKLVVLFFVIKFIAIFYSSR